MRKKKEELSGSNGISHRLKVTRTAAAREVRKGVAPERRTVSLKKKGSQTQRPLHHAKQPFHISVDATARRKRGRRAALPLLHLQGGSNQVSLITRGKENGGKWNSDPEGDGGIAITNARRKDSPDSSSRSQRRKCKRLLLLGNRDGETTFRIEGKTSKEQ